MTANLAGRLADLRASLEACAAASGASSPLLVAVSKTVGPDRIREAYGAGQRDFGENRVQDMVEKQAALADLPDLRWHFIGRLQKNKARKLVAARPVLIHSVDDLRLAGTLDRVTREEGLPPMDVLMEVNVSGEESKAGFTPEGLRRDAPTLVELPGLSIRGCMTMAPLVEDEGVLVACFAGLRTLCHELSHRFGPERFGSECSMGMTSDYRVAIGQGATIVRIGSALFHEG